ncbi:hypothetical protein ACLS0R_13650 [Comamonas jiangduensis]|uniref:hypothetical protein n=1 Tax=Comamonas jiangduensis TaxID=1194168 RepID=UPI003BF7B34D
MHLNTEMGLLIDSPSLAQGIHRTFDKTVPLRAYQVTLGKTGACAGTAGWAAHRPSTTRNPTPVGTNDGCCVYGAGCPWRGLLQSITLTKK